MGRKIMILLSGGADSSTCLAKAVNEVGNSNVCCLNAYYGQKLDKEMDCAEKLTSYYGVEYLEIDISFAMQFSNCSLLKAGSAVKHSSYREQLEENNLHITSYVPFRNGVLLSIATAIAESRGMNEIWYGAHDDDYAYPDCTSYFIEAMAQAINRGTELGIVLKAPLKGMKKSEIIKLGLELGVPYQYTWSCYEGKEKACGKCASCIDRRDAFKRNGAVDPIEYEE